MNQQSGCAKKRGKALPIPGSGRLPVLALTAIWAASGQTFTGQTFTMATFAGSGPPANVLATSAQLSLPVAVAVDSTGNAFIADSGANAVLRLDARSGALTVMAGNGTPGFSGDNGAAANAQLNAPNAVALDPFGNLYITDSGNNVIRKVSDGIITTVAGNGNFGFSGDNGPAIAAQLDFPTGIALDGLGNLYVADTQNNRIRKVSGGIITTVAGTGKQGFSGDNGPAASAQLHYPWTVAVDAAGNLYVADSGNGRIREVSDGTITTIAGGGKAGIGVSGPAINSQLSSPSGLAVDSAGNLYVSDSGSQLVSRISGGAISVLAGVQGTGFSGDGGPATSAAFNDPMGIAAGPAGGVLIADEYNYRIRQVSNGTITTIAGGGTLSLGDNGPPILSQLNAPAGVAVDAQGSVYIADTINNRVRKISGGVITTVAGNGVRMPVSGVTFSGDGGPATSAQLSGPQGVAVDAAGNLYIADTDNGRIRKVAGGIITTVAGGSNQLGVLDLPAGVAVDPFGNLYIADTNNGLIRKVQFGVITTVAGGGSLLGDNGPATTARLYAPVAMAFDAAGNLYIADSGSNRVRKVSGGVITTVAGNGGIGFSGDGGPATAAGLYAPSGVTVDSAGNLFIGDAGNQVIRKVTGGVITTVGGNGMRGFSGDSGPGPLAELNSPEGLAMSPGGLYVADTGNNRIRLLTPGTPPAITQNGIVPVYSSASTIQPGSWVSIFGSDLASQVAVRNGDFPTSLSGTSVTIDNKPAYLWLVSPTQINLQAPDDAGTGMVSVAVTTASGTATSAVTLSPQSPSLSLLGDGRHVAGEILTPNGSGAYGGGAYDLVGPSGAFSYSARPVKAGETLILYGVGFGPTTPGVPSGEAFSGAAPTSSPVTVSIGGVQANVLFAGIIEAGLYQLNVTVPRNVPGGDQPLLATVNGATSPSGVLVTVQ